MPDNDTNTPQPASQAEALFSAAFAAAAAVGQNAQVFATALGKPKVADEISAGLSVATQAAPSLINLAQVLSAIGTLFHASAHAHAAKQASG